MKKVYNAINEIALIQNISYEDAIAYITTEYAREYLFRLKLGGIDYENLRDKQLTQEA